MDWSLDLQRCLPTCRDPMFASSSSSHVPQIKHDVFISFRGADTRRSFVSHLNEALCQKKIDVYVDDKLESGDEISTALLEAIEKSDISLIIFSQEYAFSKWCLDELVKIMECWERNKQMVIPVFYNVDPSYVRNLRGRYGDAFAIHGEKLKDNMVKVRKWGIALNKAANLSGFHSSNFGNEAELIKQIVERVLKRLKHINMGQNTPKVLVGIHEALTFLESLAFFGSDAVRIIGIWGMGGIGKTTIAKEFYDRWRSEFEACCFVPNVREKLEKYEMTLLQNELVYTLLEEKERSITIPIGGFEYNMRSLRRKKVLLVLDDVNDLRKLRNLYGGHDWFGQGSRIIVTSRDKQVLTNVVDDTYEVKALRFKDSLQLFSLNAFKENYPKLERMHLSVRAVDYTKGIPLAIEVLGSSLYGKEKEVWESQLEKLENMPHPEIQSALRLSYDELSREEQDIFLLLACFFPKDVRFCQYRHIYIPLLDACGYSTKVELTKLHNKALLVLPDNVCWDMHDLIKAMGKEIVRGENKNPGKRRHLCDPDDVYQVLENATGTGSIQSLTLSMSDESKVLHLSPKAFNGMFNLKLLALHTFDFGFRKRKMVASKGLESMPRGLRCLVWVGCPLKSLPSSFCAEYLVDIDLSWSCLERLWDGVQNLGKLKRISLEYCSQLMELPDFSMASTLESLKLSGCTSLCDLHPTILSLPNLKILYLLGCNFKHLRGNHHSESRLSLFAWDCISLKEFSIMSESMVELDLGKTSIVEVHSLGLPLKKPDNLNCGDSERLPHNFLDILDLRELRKLTLDFFAPRYFFQCLKQLWLSGSNIENLPTSIKHLSVLRELKLVDCKRLLFVPELPPSIDMLDVGYCISLEGVSISAVDYRCDGITDFSFRNCRRLNQQTLNAIMLDAHVKVEQTAYIQHLEHSTSFYGSVSVCLPGSKVPADRYDYRTTTEASMTIQFSSLSNLVGLIFCVVLPPCPLDFESRSDVKFRCYLQTRFGQEVELTTDIEIFSLQMELDSDHVLLWHDGDFCESLMTEIEENNADNQCITELSVTIDILSETKIKEWGIYPVYASDIFTFRYRDKLSVGARTKRYRDSDKLVDMEPIPPTKKLKTN